ncbi:MAG: radical SAM protein [Candidatus Moraniibacteriota bacterium]
MTNLNRTQPTANVGYSKGSRMPWLRLHITNLCNFNCPGCHVFKISENKVPATNMPYAVAEEAIKSFIGLLKKYLPSVKEFMMSIYGGEPLLNRQVLYKLLEKFGSNYNNIKINWVVNTNGSLLNEKDIEQFAPKNVDIHMSIDGNKDKHNQMRIDKQGKETYTRVMDAVKLLRKYDYPFLQFETVANPFEMDTLGEIIEVAEANKVSRVHFDLFYSPDYPQNFSVEEYGKKFAQVYLNGRDRGISVFASNFSYIYGDLISNFSANILTRRFPTLEVFADGTFIFSELPLVKPFGKLADLDYDDVWSRRMSLLLEFEKEINDKCGECYLYDYCHGEMRRLYRYHTGTIKNEDNVCVAVQAAIKELTEKNFLTFQRMRSDNTENHNLGASISQVMALQKFPFVTILLSEQCNARCPHCINTLQRNQKSHMDEKKLKILIEDLLADNFPNLKLLGGEPTIHPNFVDLFKYFQSKFAQVTLFTNALNDNVKKITLRDSDYITYNGYFINGSFDTEKFLPRNPAPFLRTIQNVVNVSFDFDKFKERAIFVRDFFRGIGQEENYVMALSLDCTEDIFSKAEELNLTFLNILNFCGTDNINVNTHRNAPACFFVNPDLARIQKMRNLFRSHTCDVTYGQAIIDTDFNLKYCDRMPKILGNVFRSKVETIDFEELKLLMYQGFLWKMQDNYNLKCRGCKWWLKICNGGCYANLNSKIFDDTIRIGEKCNSAD